MWFLTNSKVSVKSKKIRYDVLVMCAVLTFFVCFKNYKLITEIFFNFHKTSRIIASVTIVRGWPYSYQIFLCKPFIIAFLGQLMGTSDQFQVVVMIELSYNPVSKEPTSSSMALGPGFNFLWVRPHEIGERTFVSDVIPSVGISITLLISLIWSRAWISGESPPWTQKI